MFQHKFYNVTLVLAVLALTNLACSLCGLGGGGKVPLLPTEIPTEAAPTPTTEVTGEASLRLDKTTFAPGEQIQVHFTAPSSFPSDAWVGIIPSEVAHGSEAENDQYDLDYQYLEGLTSGMLIFVAPDTLGSYDFRMHDTDDEGREVASLTFTVVAGEEKVSLQLDKTTFAPGEEIRVYFTALSSFPDSAWVGVIPSDVPHGDWQSEYTYMSYQYLEGLTSGELTLVAPDTPGSYDMRMYDADPGKEVASVTFQVKGD